MQYLEEYQGRVLLKIYVMPGARKSEIVGLFGEPLRLKIKISAPPIDGAANKELIKFLSKKLKLPKSALELIRGETSRNKDILVDNKFGIALESFKTDMLNKLNLTISLTHG